MPDPRIWTPEEIAGDVAEAVAAFRQQRLDEPSHLYSGFFEAFSPIFRELVDELPRLMADPVDSELIASMAVAPGLKLEAFRYLAAPPLSSDDLKTLAEAKLSPSALRADPDSARRVRDVIFHVLDPHRFPWIRERREPVSAEREIAIASSATAMAAQKLQTQRRKSAKDRQEEEAKQALRNLRYQEVAARKIETHADFPKPGQFCGEGIVGTTRADLVVGLHDQRILALECKVSNSRVNSVKRLNREAGGKARAWLTYFGDRNLIPGALLGGVFNPANVETAQREGLRVFWGHRIEDLTAFVDSTKA